MAGHVPQVTQVRFWVVPLPNRFGKGGQENRVARLPPQRVHEETDPGFGSPLIGMESGQTKQRLG